MDSSSRIIISRAITTIIFLVLAMYGFGFYKKYQRKVGLVSQLRVVCGQSSYFEQFSQEEAYKALTRAIGLLAEADSIGMDATETIDRALQVDSEWFEERIEAKDMPMTQQIIRNSLGNNYQNFIKLGYKSDFTVIRTMKEGTIPPLNAGPFVGRTPVIKTLIPSEASPGIEKVLANLVLCPPDASTSALTDIQLSSAKQLARDLYTARLIERNVSEAIIAYLDKTRKPAGAEN